MKVEDLKKELKKGNVILGTQQVLKGLRNKTVTRVCHAKTIDAEVLEDLKYYSKLTGVEIVEVDLPSDELGILCKKPFNVTVLAFK